MPARDNECPYENGARAKENVLQECPMFADLSSQCVAQLFASFS